MADFGAVLVLSYKDENSLGTRTVQSEMEVTTETQRTAKGVMAEIGDKWWYVNKLFDFVVNLFSFRAKPKDVPLEPLTTTEMVPVEYEEQYKVPYQQGRRELKDVANKVITEHKQRLSEPNPPRASRPLEYPRKKSGTLVKSISSRWDGMDKIKIGYSGISGPTGRPINYSQVLFRMNRLGMVDTAREMQNTKTASGRELRWEFTRDYV